MQDQTSFAAPCALAQIEQHVLWLLLRPGRTGPWHAQELAREIGDPEQTGVALAGLHAAGLAQVSGEFAHASYAAERFYELTVPLNE